MELNSKIILVTGCAGFIASKIAELLLEQGTTVIGLDNMNDAYSPILKEWRLARIQKFSNFESHRMDITDLDALKGLFQQHKFDAVINLAARAGVRASVENPWVYVDTNVTGTLNLLELCKDFNVKKFVLASTSSIYGANETPFNEDDKADTTKTGAEALAYTYHYLYGIDITSLVTLQSMDL